MSTPTLDELRARSVEADNIIQRLQQQIEQIKLQTTPDYINKRAAELRKENEELKKEVQRLVKELEEAEAKNASSEPAALTNLTNTTSSDNVPTPATAKAEKPTKQPQQQQQQQQQQPKEPKQKQQQQQKPKEEKKKEELPADINVSCLDFRVGKIVKCEKHPDADSLYVEQIDFNEGGKLRNVCSGLVKFIPLDQMQNRMIIGLCNLKPSKLRGVLSEAMVMCASTAEKVEILDPPAGAVPGDRVTVAGFEGTPVAELNQKNNIFGVVAPDLNVNESLVATYKGIPMEIKGKGAVKSQSLINVPVK